MASQSTNSWAIRPTCLPASPLLNFNPLFWPVSLPPPLPFNSCVTVHPDARTAAGGRGREPQWRRRLSTAAAVYKFSPIVEGGGRERGLSFFLAISPLTDLRFFSKESAPPVKCERSERGRPRSSVRMFDLLSP